MRKYSSNVILNDYVFISLHFIALYLCCFALLTLLTGYKVLQRAFRFDFSCLTKRDEGWC